MSRLIQSYLNYGIIYIYIYKSFEESFLLKQPLTIGLLGQSLLNNEKKSLIIGIANNLSPSVAPITHKRYVDDTHDRFKDLDESESFLKILNEQEPRTKFEAEYENDENELNYLDTTIINTKEGHYNFKLYRKDVIANIQIKPKSCHDERIKLGVFKGYISRAKSMFK